MISASKEDYLKIIYKLGKSDSGISNKDIAASLSVAAGSVTEMLRKLEKDGYITYKPYQGIKLTESGVTHAENLITKHRLWEVFLVERLGYPWEEVHEQAELLEHVTATHLAKRLAEFLGRPASCPHGWGIPYNGQPVESGWEVVPLIECALGARVVFRRVKEESELLAYLNRLGVRIGDTFTVTELGEYESALKLDKGGEAVYLSYKAAGNMYVEAL